jgi:hypothetical protein
MLAMGLEGSVELSKNLIEVEEQRLTRHLLAKSKNRNVR